MEHIVINIFDRDLVIVSQDESIIAVCFKSKPNYQYFLNNSRENVRSKLLQSVRDQLIKYSNVLYPIVKLPIAWRFRKHLGRLLML